MTSLTPRQIRALSAEADVAPATVQRRLDGRPVRPSTRERIEAAAQRLGLTLPSLAAAPGWGGRSEASGPSTPSPIDLAPPSSPPKP